MLPDATSSKQSLKLSGSQNKATESIMSDEILEKLSKHLNLVIFTTLTIFLSTIFFYCLGETNTYSSSSKLIDHQLSKFQKERGIPSLDGTQVFQKKTNQAQDEKEKKEF